MGLGQYDSLGEYCGPHTASSVFLILILTETGGQVEIQAVPPGLEVEQVQVGGVGVGGPPEQLVLLLCEHVKQRRDGLLQFLHRTRLAQVGLAALLRTHT